MSRAEVLRSQYQRKIAAVGQWVAIRRYSGTTVKTYTDTLTRGYVLYRPSKEFVGAVMQTEMVAVILVDDLADILPLTTNDRLLTGFYGFDNPNETPPLNAEDHIEGAKETAIRAAIKRTPGGTLIAYELYTVG